MNLGREEFNQRGSVVFILSLLVAVLSAVGILYGFSISVDFGLLGNQKRKVQIEQAADSALTEIVAYYNSNPSLLPKSAIENEYKKGFEMAEGNTFGELYENGNLIYSYDLSYVRKSIPLGESLGQTESTIYEVVVYIRDQGTNEVLTTLLGQFSRLKPVGGGVYGTGLVGGR